MTNDEAIETLKVAKSEIEWEYPMDYQIALDKAIKALEQEPILDKIRTEIKEYKSRQLSLAIGVEDLEKGKQIALEYVLAILNKYKIESNNQTQNPYKDFCKFVAKMVLRDDFEENAGANAELLCRKLSKLGIVKADKDKWVLAESEDENVKYMGR